MFKLNLKGFKAFTLAEVLVSLALIGILGAVLTPTLFNAAPRDNKIMFKKAYALMNTVVSAMINNTDIYPDAQGFADTTATAASDSYNKFCYYFKSYLNTIDNLNCPAATSISTSSNPQFAQTSDGIKWYLHYASNFTPAGDYRVKLIVDVNGDKKPNCLVTATASHCTNFKPAGHNCYNNYSVCKHPDTFIVGVRADGRLKVGNSQYADASAVNESYDVDIISNPLRTN